MSRLALYAPPATGTAAIAARDLTKVYSGPGRVEALQGVSLEARGGELVGIIGPSGCGKSTLLTVLAGLQEPTTGEVLIGGRGAKRLLGATAYMPQKDLLMPWKTVLDNTIVGLELLGVRRRVARQEALALFPRFGLDGFERHYPHTLSGGMRQRAALLRTFLARRDILLLDEPLGALDALTRAAMQEWLLDIWGTFQKTIVLVTHDIDEAIYLCDRVYIMSPRPGRIAATVTIPIARPRRYADVTTSETFLRLRGELLGLLAQNSSEGGLSEQGKRRASG